MSMMKEQYRSLMDRLEPPAALVEKAVGEGKGRRRPKRAVRAAAALAAALCLCLGVTALGAQVRPIHALLYQVSPSLAQLFVPVERSCVSSGIEMELVSARLQGDTAQFYIALRDLEGGILDESADLYDSYTILRPFDSTGTCRRVAWDGESRTAVFLVTLRTMDGSPIPGGKVTFRVGQVLSGQRTYTGISIPADLSAVGPAETEERTCLGGGGTAYGTYVTGDTARVLAPGPAMEGFPVEGMDLTGIGYADGLLHIQTAEADPLSGDSHGFFWLETADGERIDSLYNVYTTNGLEGESRVDWVDQVFDVEAAALAGCTLRGTFTAGGTVTGGDWEITFPAENN